jgi:hypothetical protein
VKRAVLLALLVSTLAAGEAGAAAAGPPDFPTEMRDTAALMLRLSDLGTGYTIGDDTGCGTGVENAPTNLAQAIIAHLPEGCTIQFEHLPGLSPYVESTALSFRTPDGVVALFGLRRELFTYGTGVGKLTEHPQGGIGDEARLFLLRDGFIPGSSGKDRPGAAVVWRRGMALGIVLVVGPRRDRATRMAQRLAIRQDGRMQKPTPITVRENDDREVPLEDPRVGVPVRWLGLRFAPRGLAPLELAYTFGPERPEDGLPGTRARLEYEARRPRAGPLDLEMWRPADWRRISRSLPGRQLWRTKCARARRIALGAGYAFVYSGWARLPSGRCPARPRDSFAALAFFRRVVVAVNMPYCTRCAEGVTGRNAPYNSVRGMKAIVRGLHLHGR